ncbi:hypothetical protein [Marinobacterium aestuariivivens]|uniref:Uncharacterized protein n=1 Tax=Marinobacterium aestuariivivens TaxID=1698799 RepID=A0ABW2A045_9GAMM
MPADRGGVAAHKPEETLISMKALHIDPPLLESPALSLADCSSVLVIVCGGVTATVERLQQWSTGL